MGDEYGTGADGGTPQLTPGSSPGPDNYLLRMLKKITTSQTIVPPTARGYGSERDPNPQPQLDPATVAAQNAGGEKPDITGANPVVLPYVAGATRGDANGAPNPGNDETTDALAKDAGASANTTPQLAPQGPKNPLLQFLSRRLGQSAPTPTAGQPYGGPTTPDEKRGALMSRLGGLAEGVNGALVTEAPTPEDRKLALQREEFPQTLGLERQKITAEQALALATLQSNILYRQGMLGARADQAANYRGRTTAEFGANSPQHMRAQASMELAGLHPDGSQISDAELPQYPLLAAKRDLEYWQGQLAEARRDALLNPQNPTFALKKQQVEAMLAIAGKKMNMQMQRLGMEGEKMMYDYGMNGVTQEPLSQDNALPGMLTDDQGNPIPNKVSGNVRPTTTERQRSGQAQSIDLASQDVIERVNANRDLFGPAAGRMNLVKFVIGNPDPRFAEMKADLMTMAALQPNAHGMRSNELVEAYEKLFDAALDPDALIAALQGNAQMLKKSIGAVGTVHTVPPRSETAPAKPKTPIHAAAAGPKVRKYNAQTQQLE